MELRREVKGAPRKEATILTRFAMPFLYSVIVFGVMVADATLVEPSWLKITRIRIGDPLDPTTVCGPLIDRAAVAVERA